VEAADQTRGKFRTFILTTLSRFLSKQYRKEKRLGKPVPLTLTSEDSDQEFTRPELASDATAEDEFNRNWARSLIERTLQRMEEECTDGRQVLYCKVFHTYLDSSTSLKPKTYREIGEELDLSETDVTNYLHRGRNIFQKLLREEVRQSVLTESEIDEELEELQRHFG
jgi:RNA polymerase sigma-70 factor (ECF subfamily)